MLQFREKKTNRNITRHLFDKVLDFKFLINAAISSQIHKSDGEHVTCSEKSTMADVVMATGHRSPDFTISYQSAAAKSTGSYQQGTGSSSQVAAD